jgi:hypothetical protein
MQNPNTLRKLLNICIGATTAIKKLFIKFEL